ncbi:2230_t:CDS:2, partial [Racocetra fulgida]
EAIDEEISIDENVESAARALMKLSQDTATSNERNDEQDFQLTDSEETILTSSTNSPSPEQPPSFESINLVSLESESQEEINLVSLESESQKLPNYPVSAKISNKKILIAEFIQKITTAASSDDIDMSVNIVNESAEDFIEKKLAQLFQTAYRSEKKLQRIKQKEIQNWYNYAEVFEDRVGQLIEDGYEDNVAQTELYDEIFPLISDITQENLRQRTHKV